MILCILFLCNEFYLDIYDKCSLYKMFKLLCLLEYFLSTTQHYIVQLYKRYILIFFFLLFDFVFAPFFFYNFYFFHGDIFKIKYGISLFGSISFLFFKLLHWGIKTCSLFLNKEF